MTKPDHKRAKIANDDDDTNQNIDQDSKTTTSKVVNDSNEESSKLSLLKWTEEEWEQWYKCPRFSIVQNTNFVVSKVPIASMYDMDPSKTFTVDMLVERLNEDSVSLAAAINATSDCDKYMYLNNDVFDEWDIELEEMPVLQDQKEGDLDPKLYRFVAPSRQQVKDFISFAHNKLVADAGSRIYVVSEYGYNRAGVLVCSFLIEKYGKKLPEALALFAKSRPPGIYCKSCVLALQRRYGPGTTLDIPAAPSWDKQAVTLGAAYDHKTELKPLTAPEKEQKATPPQPTVPMESGTNNGPPLPAPWTRGWSKRENREFFFNPETGKSVWKVEDCK